MNGMRQLLTLAGRMPKGLHPASSGHSNMLGRPKSIGILTPAWKGSVSSINCLVCLFHANQFEERMDAWPIDCVVAYPNSLNY